MTPLDSFNKFKQMMVRALGKQKTISPEERAQRAKARKMRREQRNAQYPYDSYRQRARYGRQEARRLAKLAERERDAE